MLEALRFIKYGAVSLDGGILREKWVISLGYGSLSLSVRSPVHVGTCACVTNFFSFSFFASHDSLSLSLSLRSRVQIGFACVKQFFLFFFFFCLTYDSSHDFFFGSPIPQKRTDFLDSMWEVPSWYIDSSWSHIQAAIESYLKSFR